MIVLDYSDKRPIYEQVVDRMRTLIASGVLGPDEKLPSVRALAVDLSINPNTIQRAYSELERSGFIYSVKGRGNFVRADNHLLQIQQEKLLDTLRRQMKACRDQQVELKRILDCVREVYEDPDLALAVGRVSTGDGDPASSDGEAAALTEEEE